MLKNQAVHIFFWKPVLKSQACDCTLYIGEGPTPFQFQHANTIAIERILYKRKLRHVKLTKRGATLETLSDTFGHSQGVHEGIMILRGSYPGKPEYSNGVQVIAVSKHR